MKIDRRRLFALGASAALASAMPVSALAAAPAPLSGAALTMTMADFAERILEPAVKHLASQIEADAFLGYLDVAKAA